MVSRLFCSQKNDRFHKKFLVPHLLNTSVQYHASYITYKPKVKNGDAAPSLFFPLCFLPARVTSCGMSTHIDIAHQAITWFKDARNGSDYGEIILKNQDSFIAGNPYPDAMYSSLCYSGKFHFVSEDTRWAPFLNATVNYIRKKYAKPWDQVCQVAKYAWLAWIIHSGACSEPLGDRPPGIWKLFIPWG